MTLPTHLITGLVIGKITGQYSFAIVGALFVDIDHIFSYVKNGVLINPRKFWKTITDTNDPYGDQRYILHNFLIFLALIGIFLFFNQRLGLVFGLAYLSHLVLDALDNADYFPFFPNKKINLRGPVKYFSRQEFLLMFVLVMTFFLI